MSESPSVLVSVGLVTSAKLPRQAYENIFTRYNLAEISPLPDAEFYNRALHGTSISGKTEFDIYGFLPGLCHYKNDNSIQTVVDFFLQDKKIEIVICDSVIEHDLYQQPVYLQPEAQNDVGFFVRRSLVDKIKFMDQDMIFQNQLEAFKKEGYIIFHIASPLLSTKGH